jgi:hypothetical protein
MAKSSPAAAAANTAAAATPAPEENGTGAVAAATEAKAKAPKIERLFTGSLNLNELRKAENKINWQFNRMAAQIKKMGISAENQAKILDILKAEHELKAKDVFTSFSNGDKAGAGEAAGPAFV